MVNKIYIVVSQFKIDGELSEQPLMQKLSESESAILSWNSSSEARDFLSQKNMSSEFYKVVEKTAEELETLLMRFQNSGMKVIIQKYVDI